MPGAGIVYHHLVRGFRVGAVLVAASLVLTPLGPAQHVHETDDHGHLARVVHQHLSQHALAPAPAGRHVEDDDEPILTLSAFFVVPEAPPGVTAPPAEVVALVVPPIAASRPRHQPYIEPVIHGPPRASASPRAPPLFPA